ncbi:hypothetical protein [Corynebacterium urealyticum]|uniref:hypothetical protein n=1 Tax=Corynebacterium urealyticum TaxID=43771 RepID=UPI0002B3F340|nr:hypothetical protein [Corynebacterium urealyticum]AGE36148.1 hypothetical protein CU7111_0554 [Corynebacterium urealyticum DSM 7111]QQB07825.1 hypothetical protein I6H53_01365 [Corynebacterium urealyticum]
MSSTDPQHVAIDTVVPAVLGIVLMILIWATLRSMLVLSSEDRMLGVRIPRIKRLNPVVLAAKSDFKKANTRVLLLFAIAVLVALGQGAHRLVLWGCVVLPGIQICAGLWFWVRGRRAIRQERRLSRWWEIGDEDADFADTASASESARQQYAHYQQQPGTVPRSFDQLVYPKTAGWLFIFAYGVVVAAGVVLWWNTDVHSGRELGQVYRTPLFAALLALVAFVVSYWLSFYNPSAPGQPRGPELIACMARLQRGIALLTLIGLIVVNVGVITPAVPELAEYAGMVGTLRAAGWVCAAVVLAVDILWPALTLLRLRKNAVAKKYS